MTVSLSVQFLYYRSQGEDNVFTSVCLFMGGGGVRVSLVPGPFWRVGYLGVGYIEGKTGVGYTLAPLRVKATFLFELQKVFEKFRFMSY